jgi:hypothetical protein
MKGGLLFDEPAKHSDKVKGITFLYFFLNNTKKYKKVQKSTKKYKK